MISIASNTWLLELFWYVNWGINTKENGKTNIGIFRNTSHRRNMKYDTTPVPKYPINDELILKKTML